MKTLYREGDCFEVIELNEFSVSEIKEVMAYDIETCAEGGYNITVEHFTEVGLTVITYFDEDGESRNWTAPTSMFVDNA